MPPPPKIWISCTEDSWFLYLRSPLHPDLYLPRFLASISLGASSPDFGEGASLIDKNGAYNPLIYKIAPKLNSWGAFWQHFLSCHLQCLMNTVSFIFTRYEEFPLRIFLWGSFKSQQVNAVADEVVRQLSGSCSGDERWGWEKWWSTHKTFTCTSCGSLPVVYPFDGHYQLSSVKATVAKKWCKQVKPSAFQSRHSSGKPGKQEKLVEPSPSMSQQHHLLFLYIIAVAISSSPPPQFPSSLLLPSHSASLNCFS